MNGIIWLWKHRHCWEQLKYLYEHRLSLKMALSTSQAEDAEEMRGILRGFDRVPLERPFPSRPSRVPAPKQRLEKPKPITKSGTAGVAYA